MTIGASMALAENDKDDVNASIESGTIESSIKSMGKGYASSLSDLYVGAFVGDSVHAESYSSTWLNSDPSLFAFISTKVSKGYSYAYASDGTVKGETWIEGLYINSSIKHGTLSSSHMYTNAGYDPITGGIEEDDITTIPGGSYVWAWAPGLPA
jgi:hypothetical protein